jgi:hypothetical protein
MCQMQYAVVKSSLAISRQVLVSIQTPKVAQFSLCLIRVCVVLASVNYSSVYTFCSRFRVDWIWVFTRFVFVQYRIMSHHTWCPIHNLLWFIRYFISLHCIASHHIALQTKSIVKVTSRGCFLVMYQGRVDGCGQGIVVGTRNYQQLTTQHFPLPVHLVH